MDKYENLGLQQMNCNKDKWKKKTIASEIYKCGDIVRVAQHDNVSKDMKGRFLRKGQIVSICKNGSYLVKMLDTGQIRKLRCYFIKKCGKLDAQSGDVGPLNYDK